MSAFDPAMQPVVSSLVPYERDYHGWARAQAQALRSGQLSDLDLKHLAAEIDELGHAQSERLVLSLRVLLTQLLIWDHQVMRRNRAMEASIRLARRRVERILSKSPSLADQLADALTEAYADARDMASTEIDMPIDAFPETLRYSWVEIMARDGLLRA